MNIHSNILDKINIKILKINEIQNKDINNKIYNVYNDSFLATKDSMNYNKNIINNDINYGEMKFIIIGNSN